MKFSVIVFAHNEEKRIEKCLRQVKDYTDDIVFFDTESTDNTPEIARKSTSKVYIVPYVGYCDCYYENALLRTNNEWSLHLSPDEVWDSSILNKVRSMEDSGQYNAVAFKRREFLDGVGGSGELGWHLRMFRKGKMFMPDLADMIVMNPGETLFLDMQINHEKSSVELEEDRKNRVFMYDTLIQKYSRTKLFPYYGMVKEYKKQREELVKLLEESSVK